jgi:hypothetical protein
MEETCFPKTSVEFLRTTRIVSQKTELFNVKTYFKKIHFEDGTMIEPAQDYVQWQVLVLAV